jgi:hypothetical protein
VGSARIQTNKGKKRARAQTGFKLSALRDERTGHKAARAAWIAIVEWFLISTFGVRRIG